MTADQQGVSPAAAGGATPADIVHRKLWTAAEDLANMIGCTVVDGKPRGYGEPDPRDAEIERLRGLVAEMEASRDRGFSRYAELLNPIREVLGKSPVGASHYRELREGIDELIGQLNAVRRRLKDTNAEANTWSNRASNAETELADISEALGSLHGDRRMGDTDAEVIATLRAAFVEASQGVNRQSARANDAETEIERLQGEVTRLRKLHDEAQNNRALVYGNLARRIAEARGTSSGVVVTNIDTVYGELNELIAERDRLRQDLDLAIEQRQNVARAVAEALSLPIGKSSAEPRRWHAGDPEPEIGTTVRRGNDQYTRTDDGWKLNIDFPLYTQWSWVVANGEVVEVVDSDG
jgi:chromosome segregation ATPase